MVKLKNGSSAVQAIRIAVQSLEVKVTVPVFCYCILTINFVYLFFFLLLFAISPLTTNLQIYPNLSIFLRQIDCSSNEEIIL